MIFSGFFWFSTDFFLETFFFDFFFEIFLWRDFFFLGDFFFGRGDFFGKETWETFFGGEILSLFLERRGRLSRSPRVYPQKSGLRGEKWGDYTTNLPNTPFPCNPCRSSRRHPNIQPSVDTCTLSPSWHTWPLAVATLAKPSFGQNQVWPNELWPINHFGQMEPELEF